LLAKEREAVKLAAEVGEKLRVNEVEPPGVTEYGKVKPLMPKP